MLSAFKFMCLISYCPTDRRSPMIVLLWDVLLQHLYTATLMYLYAVTINFKRQHIFERILKTQSSCNGEDTH